MNIDDFLAMADEEAMTFDQAQSLNSHLALTSANDLSVEAKEKVADYLATALTLDTVGPRVLSQLQSLLGSIQEST